MFSFFLFFVSLQLLSQFTVDGLIYGNTRLPVFLVCAVTCVFSSKPRIKTLICIAHVDIYLTLQPGLKNKEGGTHPGVKMAQLFLQASIDIRCKV